MTNKRDLERELEELADDLADATGDGDDPPTKAELGVTADFIRFEGDDPPDGPDGTSSNMVEENGAKFIAFTENTDDQDEEDDDP